jgi:DNA polymerase elongation subunit (family B)
MAKALDKNFLFFDLETVSIVENYNGLTPGMQYAWDDIHGKYYKDKFESPDTSYNQMSGVHPEFSKIVCATFGFKNGSEYKLKSFCGEDEMDVLVSIKNLFDNHYNDIRIHSLCGHYIKNFDVPFLIKRFIIMGLKIPRIVNILGKKPWELKHLVDTHELWKFGSRGSCTLDLLCQVLGIPSPKEKMSGKDLHRIYWEDQDLESIQEYCEGDVTTLMMAYEKIISYIE